MTNNGSYFKRAGELIQSDYPHIIWIPYAAYCINLMIDIRDVDRVKKI